MPAIEPCPHCGRANLYPDGDQTVCADCGQEWPTAGAGPGPSATIVRDCNGNLLAAGDSVVVVKDLKVRGSSLVLKQGTVIRDIRLVEDDPGHIEGHSEKIRGLVLKVQFLRRA